MKYVNTEISDGIERVVFIAPLDKFPAYDLDYPPPLTYAVEDDIEVHVGWVRINCLFVSQQGIPR
jgi:hypothetical protein